MGCQAQECLTYLLTVGPTTTPVEMWQDLANRPA